MAHKSSMYIGVDWIRSKTDRWSATGYCTMVYGKFVFLEAVITKSNTTAEYQAIVHECCELLFLRISLEEMGFKAGGPMVWFSN